jgi:hypothetical protein
LERGPNPVCIGQILQMMLEKHLNYTILTVRFPPTWSIE